MMRILPAAALLLAPLAAGCTIEASGLATDLHSYHEGSIRASTTEAVLGPDGRCQSDISIDPALLRPLGPEGVPLGSTECEVVARLGGPYSVEIRRGPAGQRMARLMYVSGAKIGVYLFTDNRLTAIEH
ncbi:MAG: hypothetical protein ACHQAY_00075 [Hyphomicrobiales bacterium]